MRSTLDRFMDKVSPEPNTGCWLWLGGYGHNGYGRFKLNGVDTSANRASLILHGVSVLPEQMACHRCDNPPCVNPEHLFAASQSENMMDARRKGRVPTHYNSAKTSCIRGHALSGNNLIVLHGKGRACRTCKNASDRQRRRQKRLIEQAGVLGT